MFKNKPFTYEERKQIQKHIYKGLSCCQIAKLIGRSKNGVVTEVRKGGGRFYNAREAQKRCDAVNKERYERLSKLSKEKLSGTTHKPNQEKRIENLEMQIEILHDCVKELMLKCSNE